MINYAGKFSFDLKVQCLCMTLFYFSAISMLFLSLNNNSVLKQQYNLHCKYINWNLGHSKKLYLGKLKVFL